MTTEEQRRRDEEALQVQRRQSRTFEKDDGWYFITREGVDVGPFPSELLAKEGVENYAGFSMDADRVYIDSVDVVPDESDSQDYGDEDVPPAHHEPVYQGEVFDRRRGDESPAEMRSGRVFEGKGGWYFATREGGNVGPFPSIAAAEAGVVYYVSFSLDPVRKSQT
ncbi:MAG TPA: DUF6316 family protein [Pseudomonadales bacterium]|nr:DUF6316 family protein [Pseudomonadales bacterium]